MDGDLWEYRRSTGGRSERRLPRSNKPHGHVRRLVPGPGAGAARHLWQRTGSGRASPPRSQARSRRTRRRPPGEPGAAVASVAIDRRTDRRCLKARITISSATQNKIIRYPLTSPRNGLTCHFLEQEPRQTVVTERFLAPVLVRPTPVLASPYDEARPSPGRSNPCPSHRQEAGASTHPFGCTPTYRWYQNFRPDQTKKKVALRSGRDKILGRPKPSIG